MEKVEFEFATAGRIIFGAGTVARVPASAAKWGNRALLVTGATPQRAEALVARLQQTGIMPTLFSVPGEPTVEKVSEAVLLARSQECELVIGFGGGSVIDTAKAVAALLTNPGNLLDYLEIIGSGRSLDRPSAPCIAIPTTAGTGAEVTRNAVLSSPAHGRKVSMRSHGMLPRLAVVDPELTYSLPPEITAVTGMDAFTQLLEAFVSNYSNPLTDSLCREGLKRASRSLRRAYRQGDDRNAREEMCLASLFGGLALANAKLGAVHGIAGPLGGMVPAAHGALCARLLPLVMAANIRALQRRAPNSPALRRYGEIASLLTGNVSAQPEQAVGWVQRLCRDLRIPLLSAHGLTPELLPQAAAKAQTSSSMAGNPIALTEREIIAILEEAL